MPFDYLVADAKLLPAETIRFFYLDRNFTDALVEGALSVGTVNSADHVQLGQLYGIVRDEVDRAERLVRMKDADAPQVDAEGRPIGVAGPITGFVMRSRLVSGWPGLHVRAYATDTHPDDADVPEMDTSPDRVRLLRMERLAPPVLLVLFDGVPAVVHIEEPRSGVQFGVRLDAVVGPDAADRGARRARRHRTRPRSRCSRGGKDVTVPVPFRAGSPGVINMRAARRVARERGRSQHGRRQSTRPSSRSRCCGSRSGRCSATRRSHPTAMRSSPRSTSRSSRSEFAPREQVLATMTELHERPDPASRAVEAVDRPRDARCRRRRLRQLRHGLVREPRLLVPVDVQARRGARGRDAPSRWCGCRSATTETLPPLDVHDAGTPREPGVHLLWSVPAALGRGTLVDDPAAPGDATRRKLAAAAAARPMGGAAPRSARRRDRPDRAWLGRRSRRGDRDAADRLARDDDAHRVARHRRSRVSSSTMHVGGPAWAQCYDAALGRLALHDPLDDLAGVQLEGDASATSSRVGGRRAATTRSTASAPTRRTTHASRSSAGTIPTIRRRPQVHRDDAQGARPAHRRVRSRVAVALHAVAGTRPPADGAGTRGDGRVGATLSGRGRADGAKSFQPASSGFLNEAVSVALDPARADRVRRCCTAACTACPYTAPSRPTPAPRPTPCAS